MGHFQYDDVSRERAAWNAGKNVGTKRALTQKQSGPFASFSIVSAAFVTVLVRPCARQPASRLRPGQDQDRNVVAGSEVRTRAIVIQQKTGRPIQFGGSAMASAFA